MKTLRSGFLAFESLQALPGLRHVVTTRAGGVSAGPYATLNLALHVGDAADAVLENRRRAADAVGARPGSLLVPEQCHGAQVAPVTAADAGRGATCREDAVADADAVVTRDDGVAPLVLSADCPLVILYDPERRALGLAHASWRGTMRQIAAATAFRLRDMFGCEPDCLWAGLSPSIGPCCYEVGPDLVERFERERTDAADFFERRDRRTYLNLWDLNWHQLVAAGLRADQIEVARLCTFCRGDLFYSHRRDGARTGRFGLIATLAANPS